VCVELRAALMDALELVEQQATERAPPDVSVSAHGVARFDFLQHDCGLVAYSDNTPQFLRIIYVDVGRAGIQLDAHSSFFLAERWG